MNRSLPVLITSVGLGLLLLLGVLGYRYTHESKDRNSSATLIVEVAKGTKPLEIVKKLESENVIANASHFYWTGKLLGYWGKLKMGEYEVSPRMTTLEILNILTSGISVMKTLTIPEGDNMYQVAEKIAEKGFGDAQEVLDLCRDPGFMKKLGFEEPLPRTLEGYLYPESYFLNKTITVEQILTQMVKTFRSHWKKEFDNRARELKLTPHQVVTLASVIEKETGAASERPMISSVFHNRLRKHMKLQSDPTTIYGLWENYSGNIHKKDLMSKTPYNTYVIPALPIGPITNPGIEAIKAALHPATSEFLFFVSHNDGTHEFTKTFKDHQNAVVKFQINKDAREGKSWRDLDKSKRANQQ